METKAPHKLTLGDDIFDVLPVQLADHLEWKAMSRSYQASDLHAPLLEPRRGPASYHAHVGSPNRDPLQVGTYTSL